MRTFLKLCPLTCTFLPCPQVHVVQLTLPEDEVRKRLLAALAVTDANASESSVDVAGWEALVKSARDVQGSSIPEVRA
jgi:hypothetical protein